jgi:hypothetical protein
LIDITTYHPSPESFPIKYDKEREEKIEKKKKKKEKRLFFSERKALRRYQPPYSSVHPKADI